MTLERTQARSEWTLADATRADERDTRLARLALLIGALGALALAGITLLLFPAYRGDVFAVLPWVLLAACPLLYLLGRGAGSRPGSRPGR
jgi:hypothetical protein